MKFFRRLKFKWQWLFIKWIHEFLKSKEVERVFGKEEKEKIIKRIEGLDAVVRALKNERKKGG